MNLANVASVAVLVAAMVIVGTPARDHAAAVVETSRAIAPGVTHTAIKDPAGPWRIHVVSVDLSQRSSVDVALANDVLPGWEKVSSMAKRHGAVAAINADFATSSGRPVHTFAEDGHLVQRALTRGLTFTVNANETRTKVDRRKGKLRLVGPDGTKTRIARVNRGAPGKRELVMFTRFGSWLEEPPPKACSARLYRSAKFGFGFEAEYTRARYRVDKVVCRQQPLARKGGAVLSARLTGPKADVIRSLQIGDRLFIEWTLRRSNVLDAIGGSPTLVRKGKDVSPEGKGYPYTRNPRTGVGRTSDGRVLLVTVDGRQDGYSVGMTFQEFARLFIRLGALRAINLDGGGSTEMVVNGKVANRPSGGKERPSPNALLVLPGRDPGENVPAQGSEYSMDGPVAAPTPPRRRLLREIAHDPASTGGLVAVLQDQGVRLNPELTRIGEEFRRYWRDRKYTAASLIGDSP